jgi:hypothetical protein
MDWVFRVDDHFSVKVRTGPALLPGGRLLEERWGINNRASPPNNHAAVVAKRRNESCAGSDRPHLVLHRPQKKAPDFFYVAGVLEGRVRAGGNCLDLHLDLGSEREVVNC